MATTHLETILMKTPQGHDVLAELDYGEFGVRRAKVVHSYTGVTRALSAEATEQLAMALRAKQIYEQAMNETEGVENTIQRFSGATALLGQQHPALLPYWHEAEQHRAVASHMLDRAHHFHNAAMKAIDQIAGD